jgi:hypothetical protein
VPSCFDEFRLIPALAEAVRDMGYTRPTPIQTEAIPVVLAGRDLIACASTGTGKTAAFLLPILQRLNGTSHGTLRALVLSPTRELAMQIDEQALALGYHVGITAVSVVGGVDMRPQERALRAGAEIVVATPGRLLDHMRYGYVDYSGLEVVVLDEADRMLDMGFLPDISRILRSLPEKRQTPGRPTRPAARRSGPTESFGRCSTRLAFWEPFRPPEEQRRPPRSRSLWRFRRWLLLRPHYDQSRHPRPDVRPGAAGPADPQRRGRGRRSGALRRHRRGHPRGEPR